MNLLIKVAAILLFPEALADATREARDAIVAGIALLEEIK